MTTRLAVSGHKAHSCWMEYLGEDTRRIIGRVTVTGQSDCHQYRGLQVHDRTEEPQYPLPRISIPSSTLLGVAGAWERLKSQARGRICVHF